MALGRGVGDEDVCFWGDGAGPGVVMGGVDKGVFGAKWDDGWDLGGAVESERTRSRCSGDGIGCRRRKRKSDRGMLQVVDITPVDTMAVQIIERMQRGSRGRHRGKRGWMIPVLITAGTHVKVAVMIPTDHDLVRMRQLLQPVDSGLDLSYTAIVAEVPGVNQQVSVWDIRVL